MPSVQSHAIRDDIVLVRPADVMQCPVHTGWTSLRSREGHATPCFGLVDGERMDVVAEMRPDMPRPFSVPCPQYAALVLRGNHLYAIGPDVLLRDYRVPEEPAARLRQHDQAEAAAPALSDAALRVLQLMGVAPSDVIRHNESAIDTTRGTILLGKDGFATWSRARPDQRDPEGASPHTVAQAGDQAPDSLPVGHRRARP